MILSVKIKYLISEKLLRINLIIQIIINILAISLVKVIFFFSMHKTPLTQNRLSLTQLQAISKLINSKLFHTDYFLGDGTPSQTGALSTTPTNRPLRNESNSKTSASAYNFQIHYTRARFEKFINSAFQHPQKLCLYFEQIKSNLSVKLEEISSPNNLLSHFDRIVERLLNQKTKSSHNKWTDGEVHLLTHIVVFYSYLNNTDFENLVTFFVVLEIFSIFRICSILFFFMNVKPARFTYTDV